MIVMARAGWYAKAEDSDAKLERLLLVMKLVIVH